MIFFEDPSTYFWIPLLKTWQPILLWIKGFESPTSPIIGVDPGGVAYSPRHGPIQSNGHVMYASTQRCILTKYYPERNYILFLCSVWSGHLKKKCFWDLLTFSSIANQRATQNNCYIESDFRESSITPCWSPLVFWNTH